MGVPWDGLSDLDAVTMLSAEAVAPVNAKEGAVELSILVLSQTFVATYSLPDAGELVIGRSNTVEIYVDDSLVSRRHAIITAGPRLTIRDLGSSNGTLVAGLSLEPNVERPLELGDVVLVGGTALLIQHRTTTVHPRTFWTQDQFESRLAEECARAARAKRDFSVVMLDFGRHASDMMDRQILAGALRTSDVVGIYGSSSYLLLLDVSVEQASLVMHRIAESLVKREVVCRWGIAQYPRDGCTADELIGRSRPVAAAKASVETGTIIADPLTQELFRTAERIAAGDISVLIIGETGVGKEVMAEEIHRRSKRANQPFLRINCGALSESLLESELFGHERGAFTSAVAAKPGLLETADHGTVMLDSC
jgi:GGDEF domain-containing protein